MTSSRRARAAEYDPLRVEPLDADEERIIGALIMADENGYDDVRREIVAGLTPEHFQVPRFRALFRRFEAGQRINDPALRIEIEQAGGIARLTERIATADHFPGPLRRLQERLRHQRIREHAQWLEKDREALEEILGALSRLRTPPNRDDRKVGS